MALSLGVVASATQLAAYALSIVSFISATYERVHDIPEQYRQYEVELKLLIDIAGSVQKVPALQTPEVKYHLKNTAVEVRNLQSLLCCRVGSSNTSFFLRCSSWEVIHGSQQRRISAHLKQLHKQNTALQLYITTINTIQLSSVNQTVDKIMVNTTPNTNEEIRKIGETEVSRLPQSNGASQPQSETLDHDLEASTNSLRPQEISYTQIQAYGHDRPSENNGLSGNAQNYVRLPPTGFKNYYGEVNIRGTSLVTAGNEFNSHSGIPGPATIERPQQCGHWYEKITMTTNGITSGENKFHGGDAGAGGVTGGHRFAGFDFEGPTLLHLGNFETPEMKRDRGFTK